MLTRLILIRHAKPVVGKNSDPGLSDEGCAIQMAMTERIDAKPQIILHSPLQRARETAQIVGKALGGTLETEPALGRDFNEQALLARIQRGQTVIMVGHDPTLATFGNHLMGKRFFPSGMVKSSALILEFPAEIAYAHAVLVDYLCP